MTLDEVDELGLAYGYGDMAPDETVWWRETIEAKAPGMARVSTERLLVILGVLQGCRVETERCDGNSVSVEYDATRRAGGGREDGERRGR